MERASFPKIGLQGSSLKVSKNLIEPSYPLDDKSTPGHFGKWLCNQSRNHMDCTKSFSISRPVRAAEPFQGSCWFPCSQWHINMWSPAVPIEPSWWLRTTKFWLRARGSSQARQARWESFLSSSRPHSFFPASAPEIQFQSLHFNSENLLGFQTGIWNCAAFFCRARVGI